MFCLYLYHEEVGSGDSKAAGKNLFVEGHCRSELRRICTGHVLLNLILQPPDAQVHRPDFLSISLLQGLL